MCLFVCIVAANVSCFSGPFYSRWSGCDQRSGQTRFHLLLQCFHCLLFAVGTNCHDTGSTINIINWFFVNPWTNLIFILAQSYLVRVTQTWTRQKKWNAQLIFQQPPKANRSYRWRTTSTKKPLDVQKDADTINVLEFAGADGHPNLGDSLSKPKKLE